MEVKMELTYINITLWHYVKIKMKFVQKKMRAVKIVHNPIDMDIWVKRGNNMGLVCVALV